jgi:hypothetical protein
VAHGDLHANNVGLLDTGFVIGDPTWLKVSPLSVLYEAKPQDRHVLDEMRKVNRYELTKTIDLTGQTGKAREFIELHNEVVEHMRKDRAKLLKEFRGLKGYREWNFVFKELERDMKKVSRD